MVTEAPEALLGERRADFENWGLDPDLAGGYAVITHISKGANPPFAVGEILVLDGEFGREFKGEQRKPSKWDLSLTCEWFGQDLAAAKSRSAEVRTGRQHERDREQDSR